MNGAIFFDLDGTIVDTEGMAYDLIRAVFHDAGVELDEQDHNLYEGRAEDQFFTITAERHGLPDAIKIREAFTDRYLPLLSEIQPLPGIKEGIAATRDHLCLAVVSGSTRQQISTILEATGIHDAFSLLLGCDDYQEGKPSPHPYLLASKQLSIPADRCLVIEDSAPGVDSGISAGMSVLAVLTGAGNHHQLTKAHRTVSSLAELDLMATWNQLIDP